jgi:hypothetical protein
VGSPAVDDYRAYRSSNDGAFLASQQVARSLRNLQPTAKVLMSCHTPHFLGKADTTAPDRHQDDEPPSVETKGSLLVQSLTTPLLTIRRFSKMTANDNDGVPKRALGQKKKSVRLSPYPTAGHF